MAAKPMIARSPSGNRLGTPSPAICAPPTPENRAPGLRRLMAAISAAPSRSPDSSPATRKICGLIARSRPGGRADDENIGAVGRRYQPFRLGDDGRARHHGDAGKPGARDAFDGLRTDRWQIEAPVLAVLGRLHQHAAAGRARRGHWRASRRRARASGRCLPPPPPPAHAFPPPPPPARHRTVRWRADNRSPSAISARSRSDGCTRPSVPSGTRISGATSCAPSRRKPSCSNRRAMPDSR